MAAAFLGFIPGVGAMYNGQFFKGFIHVVVFAVLIGLADHYSIFALFIAAWVFYQSFDAYHTAMALRDGQPVPDPFGLNEVGNWLNMGTYLRNSGQPQAGPGAGGVAACSPPPVEGQPLPPGQQPPQPGPHQTPVQLSARLLLGKQSAYWSHCADRHGADVPDRGDAVRLPVDFDRAGCLADRPPHRRKPRRRQMNSYIMIRRLRGPAFLLLVGVLALLNQANILSWGRSWPLFLILAGVLKLAERAVLAAGGYPVMPYPGTQYPGTQYPGAPDPRSSTGYGPYPGQPEAFIAPSHQSDLNKEEEGGGK